MRIISYLLPHSRFYAMRSLKKAAKQRVMGNLRHLKVSELCTHTTHSCSTDLHRCPHPVSLQPVRWKMEQDDGWLRPWGWPLCRWTDVQLRGGRVSTWQWLLGGWELSERLYAGHQRCVLKGYCDVCLHFRGSLCSRARLWAMQNVWDGR